MGNDNTLEFKSIEWEHPTGMIYAADRYKRVPTARQMTCSHGGRLTRAGESWPIPSSGSLSEFHDRIEENVPMPIYAFLWTKQGLDFDVALRMGLCNCGTLYLAQTLIRYKGEEWVQI